MKRFIDLRGIEDVNYRFAWFNTVIDRFETHSGCNVWDTFAEFEQDYQGTEIERYRGLTPKWAFCDVG